MDEPSSALTGNETKRLFEIMRSLKETGVSIVYISHRLEEILEISDRVTVLKDGVLVGTKGTPEIEDKWTLISMMVGRRIRKGVSLPGGGATRRGVKGGEYQDETGSEWSNFQSL